MRTTTALTPEDLRVLLGLVPEAHASFEAAGVNLGGLECLGDAVAIKWDSRLLVCGGLIPMWPGVMTAWVVLTPWARTYSVPTFRGIRSVLVDRVQKYGLWRIEASVHTDAWQAGTLAEMLGFTQEGVKRKFLPDARDAWLYAWVREDG